MSWLDDVSVDTTAMAEVKKAVEVWRELKFKMDSAEAVFNEAKKVYEEYCKDVVSRVFRQNGLESLRLDDGSTVEVVSKIRCSIQKDSKNTVADWLRAHDADNLVKAELVVMASQKEKLDSIGVPYDEEVDMNTNSVKAWVKGEIERGNVGVDDLPKGLSWFVYDEIVAKE